MTRLVEVEAAVEVSCPSTLVTALTLPIEPENMPIMLETELSTSLNASAPTLVSWVSNVFAATCDAAAVSPIRA
ncbi:hypothetical protein [Mycobacterium sp.]|uniref:hypothetical protein n=1 Tax=Mycobacterium sp. TaxID=1785 RepID=UPI003C779382